jgi:hypothetical protein
MKLAISVPSIAEQPLLFEPKAKFWNPKSTLRWNSLSGSVMVEGKSAEVSLREIVEDATASKDPASQLVSLPPQPSGNSSFISPVSSPSTFLPVPLASSEVVQSRAPSLSPPKELLPPVCEPVSVQNDHDIV